MKSCRYLVALITTTVVLALQAGCGSSPEEPASRPAIPADTLAGQSLRGVMNLLEVRARGITDRAKQETSSQGAWEAVRNRRLEELRDMLGLEIDRAKTPLNADITGRIERDGYVIEKIAFQSIPRVYVTANLYLPTERRGRVPAVIYVCGHAYSPHGAKASYQRHGHTLARHGYAAMVIDPIQIAETAGLHHGVLNQEMYEWYTRAYSPAGLEVWNAIRALDYLETRREVDRNRFAITGRSGGAAMSWFTAAVEPRIKAVVPIMGTGTYGVSVADDTQRMHCDCMYPVNFRMQDPIHLGALIAPRPLLTAHGQEDSLFPVEGYEEFEAAMTTLYESYGEPDKFRNLVVDGGHSDSDELREEAVHWLDRWLMETEERDVDTEFEEVDGKQLAVFGGEPPDNARNFQMHEFFVPASPPFRWRGEDNWNYQRRELLETLRDTVLGSLAEDEGAGIPPASPGGLGSPHGFESLRFDYAGLVPIEVLLRIPEDADGPSLLHVAAPGEDPDAVQRFLRNLPRFGGNAVMVVYTPGTGTAVWSKSQWKMALRNAMQTGRTVDSIRIGAVSAAARLLRQRAGTRPVAVSGIGPAAGWAMYAGIIDESIDQTILVRPPATHQDGPVLLAASRYADLTTYAALIAPRRLTFYGGMPRGFLVTMRIFERTGAAAQVTESMSVGAALNGITGHGFSIGL